MPTWMHSREEAQVEPECNITTERKEGGMEVGVMRVRGQHQLHFSPVAGSFSNELASSLSNTLTSCCQEPKLSVKTEAALSYTMLCHATVSGSPKFKGNEEMKNDS